MQSKQTDLGFTAYRKKRRSVNPKTPRVPLATKLSIDEWLDYMESIAAKTAAKLKASKYFKRRSMVTRSQRYWANAARAFRWAKAINRQRRASDE